MLNRWAVVLLLTILPACGGGGSPAAPPPVTTPPPRDGVVVINGSVGGRFVFSSTPNRHRDGTSFGCGVITFTERFVCVDFSDAVPPRGEVAINFGGRATGRVSQIGGTGPTGTRPVAWRSAPLR